VKKARDLNEESGKKARSAKEAFETACQELQLQGLDTDEVMSELRHRRDATGLSTDAELALAVKTRICHHERDLDNAISHIALIVQQVMTPFPPGLTLTKLTKCFVSLDQAMERLKKPFGERQRVSHGFLSLLLILA
jgi:hypothetical protein